MANPNSTSTGTSGRDSLFSEVASFFTSVRTTIVILCCLAVASILGTLIPQNVNLEEIRRTTSSFSYRLLVILDLHNVYRSWWFILLLMLLTANLLGCLLERLPKIPQDWRDATENASLSFRLFDSRPLHEVRDALTGAVGEMMHSGPTVTEADGEMRLVWVRQRVFLLGFPLIHTAIIIILVGGLIGLLYGFKGAILLREGEVGRRFSLYPSGGTASLPFDIAIESFTLSRYPSGQPKEYRSDVVLLKDGKELVKGAIRVNHPLTFEGISLYQANYELVGVKRARLDVIDSRGEQSKLVIRPSETVNLPGSDSRIRLAGLDPGATKRGAGVELEVEKPGSPSRLIKIYRNETGPAQVENVKIRFVGYDPLYATGLQIGYDPGTRIVWAGCVLLIAGFCVTLFTNLSSVSIRLRARDGGTGIQVSGRSRRDRAQFRERVEAAVRGCLELRAA